MPSSGASKQVVRANSSYLNVWGHSYAFGIGATDLGKRFGAVTADTLGLVEVNDAVSGTAFTTDASGSSWTKVLQYVTRTGRGAVSGSGVTATGNYGFSIPNGVYLLFAGINDLNNLGNTDTARQVIQHALRVGVSRFRAGAVFEDSDASFSWGGTWPVPASTTANSGAGYHYTTASGSTYTITTPADFPGGTVSVGLLAPTGVGQGGTHTVTTNGNTWTLDAFSQRTGSTSAFVLRIPNLPAGTNTLSGTVTGVATWTGVDYWQWEPPAYQGPLVVLPKQPYPVNYSSYGNTAPGPPTDTGVDYLNTAITNVATEYGARVLAVDLSAMNHDTTMFSTADSLHPSDKGHRFIANAIITAITGAGISVQNGAVNKPRYDYGTAAPTGSRVYYNVGDYVENTAPAETGTAGSMYFIAGWKCTVAGRPATWVADRRLTGN